ncbi:MAG: dephospho-CoA kinase [Treponema sp.]|nr:dephospho-CoA kinase [Treponema sp.]
MLIGLTGLYCAGKNRVAALLEKRGIPVLDVDKLGHIAIENQKTAVFSRFGGECQNPDGSVNRRLLGAMVFGKSGEVAALEAIVHPEANRLTEEWVAAQKAGIIAINAALLHKSVFFERLDRIILVSAPFFHRLVRARRRDGLPLIEILKRFSSQKRFFAQYAAGNADIYRVENPGIGKTGLTAASGRLRAKLDRGIDAALSEPGPENRTAQGGF